MKIEKAHTSDCAALTKITFDSKSYWGYSAEQMERWRDELKITEDYLAENTVYKLMSDGIIAGYYSYYIQESSTVKLDNLFVAPQFIGKGYGSILLNDFMKRMSEMEMTEILLDSDPNAEEFYARFGFEMVGQMTTSIPNRFLAKMRLRLDQ